MKVRAKEYNSEGLLDHSLFWDWDRESVSREQRSPQKHISDHAIIICFYDGKKRRRLKQYCEKPGSSPTNATLKT